MKSGGYLQNYNDHAIWAFRNSYACLSDAETHSERSSNVWKVFCCYKLVNARSTSSAPQKVKSIVVFPVPSILDRLSGVLNFCRRVPPAIIKVLLPLTPILVSKHKPNNQRSRLIPKTYQTSTSSKQILADTVPLALIQPGALFKLTSDDLRKVVGNALHHIVDDTAKRLALFTMKLSLTQFCSGPFDGDHLCTLEALHHFWQVVDSRT